MAIHDYKCTNCEKVVEKICFNNGNSDPLFLICDDCGYVMERIISSGSFVVNGYNEKNLYTKENPLT